MSCAPRVDPPLVCRGNLLANRKPQPRAFISARGASPESREQLRQFTGRDSRSFVANENMTGIDIYRNNAADGRVLNRILQDVLQEHEQCSSVRLQGRLRAANVHV